MESDNPVSPDSRDDRSPPVQDTDFNLNVGHDSDTEDGPLVVALTEEEESQGESSPNKASGVSNEAETQQSEFNYPHDQLDSFRQQWQDELQQRPSSRSQSPRVGQNAAAANKSKQSMDIEEQARSFFIQGMNAEDNGSLSLAIYYYKKALHLVPDIESKISAEFIRSPRDRVRQESESSVEDSELEENLLQNLENLNLEEEGLCKPQYEQRATHISSLPTELIVCILRWVVSKDLDLRSLEMFSRVCKGFYLFSRDESIWKLACEKIWGINLGSTKKYSSSFRRMYIERPHLLFDGCYISKVVYVRQGEQGMDNFYRPFHLVEYYRYLRFFPDGVMLMLVSADDPLQSLPKLRTRHSNTAGLLVGNYKLLESKVTCVLKRVKGSETGAYSRYRRRRQAANQNEADMTYCAEFDVVSSGRRCNAQLVWGSYTVRTMYKASGQESVNEFVLSREKFPPLIFSRVKSFLSVSDKPLD